MVRGEVMVQPTVIARIEVRRRNRLRRVRVEGYVSQVQAFYQAQLHKRARFHRNSSVFAHALIDKESKFFFSSYSSAKPPADLLSFKWGGWFSGRLTGNHNGKNPLLNASNIL